MGRPRTRHDRRWGVQHRETRHVEERHRTRALGPRRRHTGRGCCNRPRSPASPRNKMNAQRRTMVEYKPVGVSEVTLGRSIRQATRPYRGPRDCARKLPSSLAGIGPGKPDDRPGADFVEQGEIVEMPATAKGRSRKRPAISARSVKGTSHWWKNLGKETVILYVGDVARTPNDHTCDGRTSLRTTLVTGCDARSPRVCPRHART